MTAVDVILVVVAAFAVAPIAWLMLESFFALLPQSGRGAPASIARPPCAILIPAHNEAAGIESTLTLLKSELQSGDRIVVVADNCTDRTADIARSAQVEVVERNDVERRGKGYALECALQYLTSNPPAIIVVLDADTRVCSGSLTALIAAANLKQKPVQGIFTDAVRERSPREQWSAFALTFKNLVRPLGLNRLGLPCLLTGSGMAFPWHVLQKAQLGTGNIVEDMQLGIDLAVRGHAPRFCPGARFESDDAPTEAATAKRRTRWEHGHVRTLLTQSPRLFWAGLSKFRLGLIALAMELAVPPLSLLIVAQTLLLLCSFAWWLVGGSVVPVAIMTVGMVLAACTILAAWSKFGRKLISPKILFLLPVYVLWKIPIYLKLMTAPERRWVRTERKPTA